MEEYQVRVKIEKEQLDYKIADLELFIEHGAIFTTLDSLESDRLRNQLIVMKEYSNILTQRLLSFIF